MNITQSTVSETVNSVVIDEQAELDKRATNVLLRKIDLRLMPLLILLFVFSFLDRINIAHADRFGLIHYLNLSTSAYKWTVMIYYISYSLCTVPLTLLTRRLSPSKWIAIQTFIWGIITILMMFVNDLAGLLVARFVLGVAEAGAISGAYFYLSLWYIRKDQAFRIGIFTSGAVLAYIFDGILAYGIMQIDDHESLTKWQWLCLIEGVPTVCLAIVMYRLLANPANVPWLDQCEKDILTSRLLADVKIVGDNEDNESLSDEIRSACFDWKMWCYILIYMCVTVPLYSLNLFLPKIIEDISYTHVTVELLGVPPYVASYPTILLFCWSAGHFNERGYHIMILLFIEILVFFYLIFSERYLYIGAIIVGIGVPTLNALTLSWITNNITGRTKRITAVALGVAVAGIAGIVSGQIYDALEQAVHNQHHWITLAILFFTLILVLLLKFVLKYENRRHKNRLTLQTQLETVTDERSTPSNMHPNFVYVT